MGLRNGTRRQPPIAVSDARGVRSLHIGGEAIQSAMRIDDPTRLQLDYTRCMMACLLFHPEPREVLLIGLGGGSIPKFVHRHLKAARMRAVEIDPRVVDVARAQFALPPDDARLRVEIGDGAAALSPGCCDLLLVDAFEDEAPSRRTAARSFYERSWDALEDRGVMVANLMSDDPELDARLQAMEAAFRGAVVCLQAVYDPNIVAFCLKGMHPRFAWNELRERAAVLQARLGLPFLRYVNALRKLNAVTSRELVVSPDAVAPGDARLARA